MSANRHGAIFVLIGALMCAALAPVRTGASELEDVERALHRDQSRAEEMRRQAEALAREIQALRVETVSAARKAQDHETRLSAIETQLAELEREDAEKTEILATRRGQLSQTLAALQRIALQPSDALLFSPGPPIDTVRSGILLRAAIPAIEQRAAILRAELTELSSLRQEITARRGQLAETAQDLAKERARLGALIERKSRSRTAVTAEQKTADSRAARLAAKAKDLRDLIEKVEREAAARAKQEAKDLAARERAAKQHAARLAQEAREREAAAKRLADSQTTEVPKPPAPEPQAPKAQTSEVQPPKAEKPRAGAQIALARPPNIRSFPTSGQSLVMPARGKMKSRFGQTKADGSAAHGIVIAARKGAQVVAPYDGKVVYAGIFRSYGQILIIEHGGRYHTLLAGLERIDAVVGQWLLAGEPVGVLGGPRGAGPELYLELRHAGQPINPLPWLATTGDKVRG